MHLLTQIKRTIITSAPANFIVDRSKKLTLWGFQGISLYDVTNFFFLQARKTGFTERASAIAFNFVMAIPPAIIFLFTLIPFLPISEEFIDEMFELIREVIPGQKNSSPLIGFLSDFLSNPRNGLLSLGFILALFFSSNAMMGIMRSFDKGYIGFVKRNALQTRMAALKLTIMVFFIVVLSIGALALRGNILVWLGVENEFIRGVITNLRWIVIFMLFFYTISFIYRHAPAREKKWRLINPGSILATFLMIVFTMFFSYWVNHFGRYNQLYGSIGTVLIVMLLIYFNSLVLLIGFELNVSISSLKRIADERKKEDMTGPASN
jgi:membrane protein